MTTFWLSIDIFEFMYNTEFELSIIKYIPLWPPLAFTVT